MVSVGTAMLHTMNGHAVVRATATHTPATCELLSQVKAGDILELEIVSAPWPVEWPVRQRGGLWLMGLSRRRTVASICQLRSPAACLPLALLRSPAFTTRGCVLCSMCCAPPCCAPWIRPAWSCHCMSASLQVTCAPGSRRLLAMEGREAFGRGVGPVPAVPAVNNTAVTASTGGGAAAVWAKHRAAVRKSPQRRKEMSESVFVSADGKHRMPFAHYVKGAAPPEGHPLFICLHGGGGCHPRVNDGQYEQMKSYWRREMQVGPCSWERARRRGSFRGRPCADSMSVANKDALLQSFSLAPPIISPIIPPVTPARRARQRCSRSVGPTPGVYIAVRAISNSWRLHWENASCVARAPDWHRLAPGGGSEKRMAHSPHPPPI